MLNVSYLFCIFLKGSGTNLLCCKILKVEASPQHVTLYTLLFISFNKSKKFPVRFLSTLPISPPRHNVRQPFPINDSPLLSHCWSGMTSHLTSSPFLSVFLPDQKRWAQVLTARPWSGFFRSLDAARAHWVLKGSWFSSLKHIILSKVPMIKVMAASCALESLISSSYRENAWCTQSRNDL